MAPMTASPSPPRSKGPRIAVLLALLVLAAIVARLDLRPSLAHVQLRLLSGPEEGNYNAIAARISASAATKRGRIENVMTAGSADNIKRLAAAASSCEVGVAIVQAGLPFPESPPFELYGHLEKAESMFFLGRRADTIKDFADLSHLRVGIGPEGGGTASVVRRIFESRELAGLGVVFSFHSNPEQLEMAQRGDLDLAVFVMDEDASLMVSAVRDMGLQIAGLPHADVIARRFHFLRHGRIGAGQFDPVRMLPPVDKRVLRVDTLVVGNGCAKRSQVIGLMKTLGDVFPGFVRHNRETANETGLQRAAAAQGYLDSGGPEVLDDYLPRVGDIMPASNWVHLAMVVSVLFNLMGGANRFVLWRIDVRRVRSERDIALCFGAATTLGDIARLEPKDDPVRVDIDDQTDRIVRELAALGAWSRRASLSVLVPMGGEMAYRYQENLIHETLAVLRAFRERRRRAFSATQESAS